MEYESDEYESELDVDENQSTKDKSDEYENEFDNDDEIQCTKTAVPNSDYMKKLTLELMINKKHFKKVLEKTDNEKFEKMKSRINTVKRISPKISSMTDSLLANYVKFSPADNYNEDIRNIFEHYVNACLEFIVRTEENKKEDDNIYHKETDVIFESLNEKPNYVPTNVKNAWGKSINKATY